jgi:hypothetical protein
MSNEELELTIRKARKLKELRLARQRVKRLEQELSGEAVQAEDPPYVPEFLRVQVGAGRAERLTDFFGRNVPIARPPASPQRSCLPENLHALSRHHVVLLPEPTP